ncbi:MAG TPA: hypothetical protein DDZ80_07570 [Cyanobacteria bacterium UBA8803]|nr:hypothetical protein [Cyanobacteria bacterium UBA9273]HBL58370.1 hypothetical protein [Cyanobacteria bacterium UBA8803]
MDVKKFKVALDRVNELHKQREYDSAIKLVQELIACSPYSVDLLVKYAKLIQLLDKDSSEFSPLEAAPRILKLAHLISPDSIKPCIELGYFEYAVNDSPFQAMQYFQMAQEKAESSLKEVLIGQIKCYIDINNISQASEVLERAKLFFPDDIDIKMIEAELE